MKLSLSKSELQNYISCQLNNFFPDKYKIRPLQIAAHIDTAIDRLDNCFSHVSFNRYNEKGQTNFNHLYKDQNIVFLWFLANTIWKNSEDENLYTKVYYLNKVLHSFDCMYNTELPDIFLVLHGAGTMLGKATYSDYFVVLQGCTVGSHKGQYPVLGKGFTLTANSSIIGNCVVGKRCTISTRTTLFQKSLPDDSTAFLDFEKGTLQVKSSAECYAQQYFNVDLKTVL